MPKSKCIIVGINGASGSGKSYLADKLATELKMEIPKLEIGIISEDSYYKEQTDLSFAERELTNYDHPDAMEHALLVQHLQDLKQAKDIQIPIYNYIQHTREPAQQKYFPACKVVILEGVLILLNPKIRASLDLAIYLNTPLDICFIRRLLRDTQVRGRTVASVVEQYQQTVKPMFLEFIEANKKYAEITYDNSVDDNATIAMIKQRINTLLAKNS